MAQTKVPPGSYVQVGVQDLADGEALAEVNAAIGEAYRRLTEYQAKSGTSKGRARVTLVIELMRVPDSEGTFMLSHTVALKTPTRTQVSTARAAGAVLLCQPQGASGSDPDQMRLAFDRNGVELDAAGRPKGATDHPVAGVIGK